MDSTPLLPQPQPQPQPQPHPLKPSASKLPIKRKTPFPQHPSKLEPQPPPQLLTFDGSPLKPKPKTPPFKFHRVWTEPDEISFLQGLLQSRSLSFPKDLPIFYSNFSNSISRSYTKSQLSEKLRRLRKKFRVISSRLARGLNASSLSAHDLALFDLSKRLWSPEFASTSPFGNDGEVKINEDFRGGRDEGFHGEAIDLVVAKSVLEVFDECFKEVRLVFEKQGVVWMDTMERRWKEQKASELDLLGRRLRLVIENSLSRR
ncbi:probable transcription factor At1g44810 [Durio zibethinus]|uniref:Probable transcription factor At1g44810 n=1 Tax=Durio zibethinus TaxID=66656 RepID=A0A6P5XHS2_DURZI|nr:probable transcription factor At1g44810 [Durio zibethinus]